MLGRRRRWCSPGAQQENDDEPLGKYSIGNKYLSSTLFGSGWKTTKYIHSLHFLFDISLYIFPEKKEKNHREKFIYS